MGKRVNLRLEPNSKVFMSMLKSALYILLLPMLISIGLAVTFLMHLEREAEGFRGVALEQLVGEVNQEFWSAYQLINRVKNSDLIVSYAKSEERDYWAEYQIHKYMSKVLVGTNLEMAYLYFPQYEMVFSVTGGRRAVISTSKITRPPLRNGRRRLRAGGTGSPYSFGGSPGSATT